MVEGAVFLSPMIVPFHEKLCVLPSRARKQKEINVKEKKRNDSFSR